MFIKFLESIDGVDQGFHDKMLIPPVEDEEEASAEPTVKANGGVTVEAEESKHSYERPNNCYCTPPMGRLPCCPCYRNGFEEPNPNVEEG